MPGLFDLLTGMLGQSDPRQQLAARLNPVSGPPVGQAPPPGPPSGPSGGGVVAPPVGQPPPAGGAQPPPAPPTPTAYQSPPDQQAANARLASPTSGPAGQPGAQLGAQPDAQSMGAMPGAMTPELMLQLYDRTRREDQFNRGMAGLAKAIYPGRTSDAWMQSMTGNQNPNQTFNSLMQLQEMQQGQQVRQAQWDQLPKIADSTGIPLETLKADFLANKLPDVLAMQSGVGGPPDMRDQKQAQMQWRRDNPNQPMPAYMTGDPKAYAAEVKRRAGDQVNLEPALTLYDNKINQIDELLKNDSGLKSLTSAPGRYLSPGLMSDAEAKAWQQYQQVMAGQFTEGVQDFPGSRISTKELVTDAPSKSQMGNLGQGYGNMVQAAQDYRARLVEHRAQLFGKAQVIDDPRLTNEDYKKYIAPSIYAPGKALGPGSTTRDLTTPTPAVTAPPAEAIAYLKNHPETQSLFESKYGSGAAKVALGQ